MLEYTYCPAWAFASQQCLVIFPNIDVSASSQRIGGEEFPSLSYELTRIIPSAHDACAQF